jgi:diguanylate cyclase (GGDEF)-like protein/PAS domain S-box-containing protein
MRVILPSDRDLPAPEAGGGAETCDGVHRSVVTCLLPASQPPSRFPAVHAQDTGAPRLANEPPPHPHLPLIFALPDSVVARAGSIEPASLGGVSATSGRFAVYRRLALRATAAPASGLSFDCGSLDPDSAWTDTEPHGATAADILAVERLAQAVVSARGPLAIADLRTDPEWTAATRGTALQAFLGVPLRPTEGGRPGCLYVFDRRPRPWTNEQVEALLDLAEVLEGELRLRLEASERRGLENLVRMLGKAVENMQLGVTVTDTEGKIVYTNPAEARMHGYEVRDLVGQHARLLGPPESTRTLDAQNIRAGSSWTRETVNVRKDGSRFPVLLWSDLVTDADGRTIGIVTCSEDITERKRAEQALRDYALRDPLTGLPNRVHFLDRLTQAIHHRRGVPEDRFAVLFLDLDRFKVVNDSLGHHVGDELLGVIANRLLGCLRPSDTVARFGGDEFAILLEEIAGVDDAIRVAQRVLSALTAPIQLHGYELFTSGSVGIVMSSTAVEQPEYLWRSADMAMYRAKARGTGLYEIFDRTMHADALARLQLETDLRRAIEREEFRLHYQPVIDLKSGAVVGFEALLRWEHPLRGLVYPSEVIPVAEETGMIVRLGEWVLNEGCRQLVQWQRELGDDTPLWVGVNLSSKQLSQPNLLDTVEAAVRDTGIEPHMLKLEITESGVIENSDVATRTLRQLKSLGVQLFMDDFGTGYSSLSYLHRLPLDALKIDRSFVSQMVRGDRHAQLVNTILQLARSVNLRVVAEGVSTPDQLELLREFGCELAQGFLFSHALPPDQVPAFLEGRRAITA